MNNADQDQANSQNDNGAAHDPGKRVVPDEIVMREERDRIKARRQLVKDASPTSGDAAPYGNGTGDPRRDAVGLALSGGGIRSATFNLGLLQALQHDEMFWKIDYLSTVSGGGYIGSCLTWFMSCLKQKFPFGIRRADNQGPPGAVVNWLRDHGRYLTPGRGMGAFALVAAVLTGLAVNLIILLPVFITPLLLLHARWPLVGVANFTLYPWVIAVGSSTLIALAVIVMFQALVSGRTRFSKRLQSLELPCEKFKGLFLCWGIILLLVGWIPVIHHFIHSHGPAWAHRAAVALTTGGGGVSIVGALLGRKPGGNNLSWIRTFFLCIGLWLVIYGFAIWLYGLGVFYSPNGKFANAMMPSLILATSLLLCFLLGCLANINRMSLHRFYRNRLKEAYLPAPGDVPLDPPANADPESCLLKDLKQTEAPYPLINAAQNTVGSKTPQLRERGADNFLFSPLYCGSTSTDYMKTSEYCNGGANLATAMAISGAAVDPNTYATRSRALSFIMSFLNVRLGYWINKPGHKPLRKGFWRPPWFICMFSEMFGNGLSESRKYLHLSDGGQFENLGLYELVRRKCRWIIVSDATADPHRQFPDLGKAIELVRTDFGARLELDTAPLRVPAADGTYSAGFTAGKILYADGTDGNVLYVKPTILENTPEDVLAYHRKHPTFPAQSTGDQFFDEQQFEAYRELGFQIGRTLKDSLAGIRRAGFWT